MCRSSEHGKIPGSRCCVDLELVAGAQVEGIASPDSSMTLYGQIERNATTGTGTCNSIPVIVRKVCQRKRHVVIVKRTYIIVSRCYRYVAHHGL